MNLRGLCARVNPPSGHKSTRSARWYTITLQGEPPRPFVGVYPLQFENFDTKISNQICNLCYHQTRLCAQLEPPLILPLPEISINSLCENMSRLCDVSTEAFVETRTSETQTCDFLSLAVNAVECALSPKSDVRRALSRGIKLTEPLVVQTRGTRHTKAYMQLPTPVSDAILGERAVRQRSEQVHKCLQFIATGSPKDSTIAELQTAAAGSPDLYPAQQTGLCQLQAKVRSQLPDHMMLSLD